MYNYIEGIISEVADNYLVVDVGGIGYEIIVSSYCLNELGKIGKSAKIFTYLAVREDDMSLYGFYSKSEKAMFLRLISVSGIGPKLAISILGGISIDGLATSIISADTLSLNHIKGVGKKTAERIVLELKDKIGKEFEISAAAMTNVTLAINEDAVLALMSLGYTKQEASIAITKVKGENLSIEQIIMQALKG